MEAENPSLPLASEPGYKIDFFEAYADPRVTATLAAYDAAIIQAAGGTGEARVADRLKGMRLALAAGGLSA